MGAGQQDAADKGLGQLTLVAAHCPLRTYLLTQSSTTIGRRATNLLVLDDLTVSGEHAILLVTESEAIIQDLDSRNGTLLNGKPVARALLNDGDCIDIGVYRLIYHRQLQGDDPLSLRSPDQGPARRPSSLAGQSGRRTPNREQHEIRHPVDPARFPPLRWLNTDGSTAGAALSSSSGGGFTPWIWPVPEGHEAASGGFIDGFERAPRLPLRPLSPVAPPVGRQRLPLNQPEDFHGVSLRFLGGHDAGRLLLIDRPIVSVRNGSGQVAVVTRRPDGFYLTHVEGHAYPLVNGESIGLGAHPLRNHDLIELSGTIIQFSQSQPEPPA